MHVLSPHVGIHPYTCTFYHTCIRTTDRGRLNYQALPQHSTRTPPQLLHRGTSHHYTAQHHGAATRGSTSSAPHHPGLQNTTTVIDRRPAASQHSTWSTAPTSADITAIPTPWTSTTLDNTQPTLQRQLSPQHQHTATWQQYDTSRHRTTQQR